MIENSRYTSWSWDRKASQDLTNIYASKEQELELRTNFISKKVNIWENDIENTLIEFWYFLKILKIILKIIIFFHIKNKYFYFRTKVYKTYKFW